MNEAECRSTIQSLRSLESAGDEVFEKRVALASEYFAVPIDDVGAG